MKIYIHDYCPEVAAGTQTSGFRFQKATDDALQSISPELDSNFIISMPARCRSVLEASGGSTKY